MDRAGRDSLPGSRSSGLGYLIFYKLAKLASVVEQVDTQDLKFCALNGVRVRAPPEAPTISRTCESSPVLFLC